jgi:hypothetical protein
MHCLTKVRPEQRRDGVPRMNSEARKNKKRESTQWRL